MTLTAGQKRQVAQVEYNAMLVECPARQLLETISSKWVTLIMLALAEGSQRHSVLRSRLPGVSQKVLTSTLRSMERDGIVEHTLTTMKTEIRSEYSLTMLGTSLLDVIASLKDWAESNMPHVAEARAFHDRRKGLAS